MIAMRPSGALPNQRSALAIEAAASNRLLLK
jgi:hypothetical protein